MATSNPLEDQVTCSVCFDIYKDPHTLTGCLHTFCLECIEQLEVRGQIECPECRQVTQRKDVKRDFKTQGFIDAVRAQQKDQSKEISSAECGMCHNPDKPVRYHCIECEHYMCVGCQEAHAGMKVCTDHKVKSVAEIIEKSEKHFKELIHEFEEEQTKLHQKASQVDKNIMSIEESEKQQLGEVKQFTEDAIRDLKENEKILNKIIKEANAALIRSLKEIKEIFSKGQAEIQNVIDFLNCLIKRQNIKKLFESAENTKQSMKMSIKKIQSSLTDVQLNMQSPVMVKKGEDWDVKGCIEVKVDEFSYGSTALKPLLQSLYSDICKTKYVEKKTVTLDNSPRKLCQIKQEIWCCVANDNNISVYNKQGQKMKKITHQQLGYIRGMAHTHNNHVIVACGYGLHQLDINGQYQGQVAEGYFSDVSTYGEQVYALDCNESKILILKYMNEWRTSSEIDLHYSSGSAYDKLCVSKYSIYVSSEDDNCMYKYNFKGELQHEIKQDNNNLHICGVDDRENLLVADYTNSRIQVYDREGSWRVLPLSGDISGHMHALLDDEDSIWVAGFRNGKLTKFEK